MLRPVPQNEGEHNLLLLSRHDDLLHKGREKHRMRAGLSLCIVLELDPYDLIFGAKPEAVETLKSRRPAKGNMITCQKKIDELIDGIFFATGD